MSRSLALGSHSDTVVTWNIAPPPIRLNRAPGEEERIAILEVIERDERGLIKLQDLADKLSVKVYESKSVVSHSLVQLQHALLRQEAAEDLHKRLSKATEILGIVSQLSPRMETLGEESKSSPHLIEAASTLRKQSELTDSLTKHVKEAMKVVERAVEAVALAEETYRAAAKISLLQEKEQERSRESIKALKGTIEVNRAPLHPIFRTPRDIWEQILAEVVFVDRELEDGGAVKRAKGWGHGYRTLMLSSVCYNWRIMIRSLPSLWRNVYIPLDLRLRSAASRIRTHLKYSKAVPLRVAIYAPIAAVPIQSLESPLSWDHLASIESVTCSVSHYSHNILSDVLKTLPPPASLTLSGDRSLGPFPINNRIKPLLLPDHFFRNMEFLMAADVPTRAGLSVSTVNPSALTYYVHYGQIMTCLLPNWIPRLGANLTRFYFDADRASLLASAQTPLTLTNVSELLISIPALAHCVKRSITFPSLKFVQILQTEDATEADWLALHTFHCEQLGILYLKSIERKHALQFLAFLSQCRTVYRLILHGKAANTILGERADAPIPRFRHIDLVIVECSNGYQVFLSYLQRLAAVLQPPSLQAAGKTDAVVTKEKRLRSIRILDCPEVDQETRAKISALLSHL